jgi:hypothetical protein
MYTTVNFKTKKALKEAFAAGKEITVYQSGPFLSLSTGKATIEGPHYPEPHRWYARVLIENNRVVKIIG